MCGLFNSQLNARCKVGASQHHATSRRARGPWRGQAGGFSWRSVGSLNRAKINVLPFGGACFKEKMIVRGAILPGDYYKIKRLILVQTKTRI